MDGRLACARVDGKNLIIDAFQGSFNGDAYGSVMYQNENLSVRVSDEFMQAALEGRELPGLSRWRSVRAA